MLSSKKIPILGIRITQYQTLVLITTFLILTATPQMLLHIAKMETVDNLGLLLHKKHPFPLVILLNARPKLLLMQNSKKTLTLGTKITLYQTLE